MPKITKRLVDAAEARSAEYFVWDSEIPGFGLRVLTSGRKGYVLQYRAGRRSRWISLGPSTLLTCGQARNRAISIVAAARNGEDPAAERDAGRKAITVKELAERFDKEHIAIRVKASTAKEYRRNLERFILPAFGQLTITGITRADVAKFHHDLRHIPYQANRCLEVVSKMFSLAEMWGLRPDGTNPRKHIREYPEEKRERFLSAAELRRIAEVLREMEAEGIELPSAILAARLLILTGCRLNEIMTLKWAYVDLVERVLRLPDSKSGAKVVHLGQPAVELLRDAQRIESNPWVISGTLPGKRLSDLQPFWQRVRARAVGSVRSSYSVLKPGPDVEGRLYGALMKSSLYIQALRLTSNFIRDGQDLNFSHVRKVKLPKPDIREQAAIADHIEAETARIDGLIALTERSIDLLREKRSALITAAVTGKIDVRAAA